MNHLNQLLESLDLTPRIDYETPEANSAETLAEAVVRMESELGISEEAVNDK